MSGLHRVELAVPIATPTAVEAYASSRSSAGHARRDPKGRLAAVGSASHAAEMSSRPNSPVAFEGMVAHLMGDRTITVETSPPGPTERVDGYSIGVVPVVAAPGPHRGEMHPDGDELLCVLSGTMDLILDDGDNTTVGAQTSVRLNTGDAFVVPQGIWHRLEAQEPSTLLHDARSRGRLPTR